MTDQNMLDSICVIEDKTIQNAISRLALRISNDYSITANIALVGILTGAAFFTVDLARELHMKGLYYTVNFLHASSYGSGQTQEKEINVTGFTSRDEVNLDGKHIIVLDELYDSGRTLAAVVKYLAEFSCASIKTCVMFRKQKNEPLTYPTPHYCAIDNCPDVWYMGYGLDDENGCFRGCMDLFAVPRDPGLPKTLDDNMFERPDDDILTEVMARIHLIDINEK